MAAPDRQHVPRVVVVGGGFGGAYTARALLKRTRADIDVTVISTDNFLLFTPLLPEAACGAIEPRHVVVPLRQMLPGGRVIVGEVTSVDTASRRVTVQQGESQRVVEWDRLVLAPGGVPRVLPIPGLVEHAIGVKSLAEGVWLRNHVIDMLERADSEPDAVVRRRLLGFVVVGGGYAGVEFVAELQAMCRRVLAYYPGIDRSEISWSLVDAGPGILREIGGDLGDYARDRLVRRGIRVLSQTTIVRLTEDAAELSTGEVVPARTVVWAAGVAPSPLVRGVGELDRDRLVVDSELRVPGVADVWALGDCAAVPNAADAGAYCPPTSQHALRQARAVARNVAASLGYGRAAAFSHANKGGLATLGTYDGVAKVMGVRLRGFPAWWLARSYHLLAMPTLGRKLRVALDWTTQLLTGYDPVHVGQIGNPPRLGSSAPAPDVKD